jgi:hypothetical protein
MQPSDNGFITGLDLSESFYNEAVQPILLQEFSGLLYAAALTGSGSEVLGFDTEMSRDHHWGPRVMLFVSEVDIAKYKSSVTQTLSERLPRRFRGFPTSYTAPNPDDNGVQLLDYREEGSINHRVSMTPIRDFFMDYLGFDINHEITPVDWLTFPDQKLLSITAGRVFHDEAGLKDVLNRFAYYPHDVWLYLLAAGWARIEQEEHLMGRAGSVGDEIGSAIIASRLVRDLMRLCFLMEKRYAPYPKWFGTAFRRLASAGKLEPVLARVLSAEDWQAREKYLMEAYEYVANLHNQLAITEPMPTTASQFFGRPFFVISKGVFSKAISAEISDRSVREIANKPLIGSIDQLSDSTDLQSDPIWRAALRGLYGNSKTF